MTAIGGQYRVEAGERRSENSTREQLKELRLRMGKTRAEAQGGHGEFCLRG